MADTFPFAEFSENTAANAFMFKIHVQITTENKSNFLNLIYQIAHPRRIVALSGQDCQGEHGIIRART